MIVKKSVQLWDHVPKLDELREQCNPDFDNTIETFKDGTDIELYLRYTGLRLYTNGRDLKNHEKNIRSEMKYTVTNDTVHYPKYEIPDKKHFILI